MVQTLIVGAGPIGLATAISAKRRGFVPLIVDAGAIANSIVRYPVGMVFFTTPERLEIGDHPMVCSGAKPTREEALKYYRGVARTEGLDVLVYTKLVAAERRDDRIQCRLEHRSESRVVSCDRLVLAVGYFDHPNLIGVPGEALPHVTHYPEEPHGLALQDVVIVGGKNSAIELALSAHRAGARVRLVYRGAALKPSVKYWLKPDFENRVKAGEIEARFETEVVSISERDVTVRSPAGEDRIAADRVFLLTGYHPDFDLFRRIGIELDGEAERPVHDPMTHETNMPGVFLAGSVTSGRHISEVFIENGKFDGEKIFGDTASRKAAIARFERIDRPVGE